ncbi:MAG TPA: hypothetical protein DEO40_01015 [Treponema sp.]|nr:hypothetical protein [Treponema sp.]
MHSDSVFRVWVDADSCPAVIRKIIVKNSILKSVPVVFVANRDIPSGVDSGSGNSLFKMVVVEKENGASDDYIFSNAQKGDVAVTRDLPLAKRLLEKEVVVMNDRGTLFTERILCGMLEERALHMQMMSLGLGKEDKSKSFGRREIDSFAECFSGEFARRGL